MFEQETNLVNEEFINRKDTYNIRKGGKGGWTRKAQLKGYKNANEKLLSKENSERRRKKIIDCWKKGIGVASTTSLEKKRKKNIENPTFKGKHHTEETKKRIGEANKRQTGKKNSQYGTCWIYNQFKSMKIRKEEFKHFEKAGWKKGRKIKFNKRV